MSDLDELARLSAAATPGPWAATYQEYDDWGVIRTTVERENRFRPVVCAARVLDDEREQAAARRENRQPRICGANASLIVAAVNRLREEIASHPAGQRAGSGADTLAATLAEFQRRNGYHRREIEELLTEFGELLLSKVKPAPDSTRTGQGEAEADQPVATVLWFDPAAHPIAENKPRKIIEASLAFMDAAEIGTKLYARPLAARPAAPEAQGAWLPISAAPRNDTLVMLGWWCDVGGEPRWIAVAGWYEAGPADRCWYAAYDEERVEPTHWQPLDRLPVPPASSGQGGR